MLTKELLTEGLSHDNAKKIINNFINFAQAELQLPELPNINLTTDSNNSIKQHSFGGYGMGGITLSISNRHIMDVCRTLAHELVHFKQDLEGRIKPDSGKDGSEEENEANASAAVVMRKWGKTHPNLFGISAIE